MTNEALLSGKYPHMFPGDIAIWERFLQKYGSRYLRFDYDIKVGSIPNFPSGYDPYIYRMGEALWKKRIDVVAVDGFNAYIIEVKPNASMGAVGQVLSYAKLYEAEYKPGLPVVPMIVTDNPDKDLSKLCDIFNIRLVIV
jgi:hypothetical protein